MAVAAGGRVTDREERAMTDAGDVDGVDDVDDVDDESLAAEERVADAVEFDAVVEEQGETAFDETRHAYSGVIDDSDADVDVEEYEEAGALFDDPERIALLEGGIDDPDGIDE
jgi:hypothetical protein